MTWINLSVFHKIGKPLCFLWSIVVWNYTTWVCLKNKFPDHIYIFILSKIHNNKILPKFKRDSQKTNVFQLTHCYFETSDNATCPGRQKLWLLTYLLTRFKNLVFLYLVHNFWQQSILKIFLQNHWLTSYFCLKTSNGHHFEKHVLQNLCLCK